MDAKLRVGILGATGAVGQRFIELLQDHPWFEVAALYASERSAGKRYADAVDWRVPAPRPAYADDLVVQAITPAQDLDLVFSALPSQKAETIEPLFAGAGIPVISNASAFRMAGDVPLLIPEVNPDHAALIAAQQSKRSWPGFIITNPNCAVIGLVLPLKPLHDAFGLKTLRVVTMQARSGAGYPGPPQELIGENVLPHIGGEEEKLETEPRKLLGRLTGDHIAEADFRVSAHCLRVDVPDGHTESVFLNFESPPTAGEATKIMQDFRGLPQEAKLPSAPDQPVVVFEEEDRPQPKRDIGAGNGMSVTVGQVRNDIFSDLKFTILSHNTIRGAAGAAILNAELLKHQGIL